MAAHRFWRLHISENWGDGNYTSLAELVLAATPGGAQGATGGTATASSERVGSESAQKAFDGSPATYWRTGSGGAPAYIQYDMGAGKSLDVAEVRITTHSSAGTSSYPRSFVLLHSDDGIHWTPQRAWSNEAFTHQVEREFDATPLPANQVENRVVGELFRRVMVPNIGGVSQNLVFSVIGKGLRHHTAPSAMTPYSGSYFIQGSTTALGQPLARRVDLYDQKSGLLVGKTFSKEDGAFRFDQIGPGPFTVVGVDVSAEQNSVIYAHVTPSPMI